MEKQLKYDTSSLSSLVIRLLNLIDTIGKEIGRRTQLRSFTSDRNIGVIFLLLIPVIIIVLSIGSVIFLVFLPFTVIPLVLFVIGWRTLTNKGLTKQPLNHIRDPPPQGKYDYTTLVTPIIPIKQHTETEPEWTEHNYWRNGKINLEEAEASLDNK